MSRAIYIYAGEAARIARWTREFPDLETGGELLVQYLPSGAVVVHLATGPGPRARRSETSFHQDPDYLRAVCGRAWERHALQHGGSWHSHHTLSLAEPSGGDSATVERALERTGVPSFLLAIANLADAQGRPARGGTPLVHGFLYTRESRGSYEPLRWAVLPGESPVRRSAALADLLPEPRLADGSVRLEPRARDVEPRRAALREGSWAQRPEGIALLRLALATLGELGPVRMFPSEHGLLELHVDVAGEQWVVTFDHETEAARARAFLTPAGAHEVAPLIVRGPFADLVTQIAGLIAARHAPIVDAEPIAARPRPSSRPSSRIASAGRLGTSLAERRCGIASARSIAITSRIDRARPDVSSAIAARRSPWRT